MLHKVKRVLRKLNVFLVIAVVCFLRVLVSDSFRNSQAGPGELLLFWIGLLSGIIYVFQGIFVFKRNVQSYGKKDRQD